MKQTESLNVKKYLRLMTRYFARLLLMQYFINNYRQKLHMEPEKGWMNDPNGLCFFKGEYHVYFQYSPDSAEGKGRKCWGHFTSSDLIGWELKEPVLFPDISEDRNGVFSGSGIIKNGLLYLFYTGNVEEDGDHDYINSGRGANVISVTTEDGQNMSEKRVLLRNSDYPDYCSCHVRDPKVWEENGSFHMVLGARTRDGRGCVLRYVSDDLLKWEYEKTYWGDDGSYMWECPDEFVLGTKRFLSVSPQGLTHGKYLSQNIFSSGYFSLEGDSPVTYREWDAGFDFYAPQSFIAPDGRRILIGWEGIGDIPYTNPTTGLGWQHCLTLPRELSLSEDGYIRQMPVRELRMLRKKETEVISGGSYVTVLPFEFQGEVSGKFYMEIKEVLRLRYEDGEFSLEFTDSEAGGGRSIRYVRTDRLANIDIIADTSSIEIYLNDGERVLSSRMYPKDTRLLVECGNVNGVFYSL